MAENDLECSALENSTVFPQEENPNKVQSDGLILQSWEECGQIYPDVLKVFVAPGELEASKSYITMSE